MLCSCQKKVFIAIKCFDALQTNHRHSYCIACARPKYTITEARELRYKYVETFDLSVG